MTVRNRNFLYRRALSNAEEKGGESQVREQYTHIGFESVTVILNSGKSDV